VDSLRGYSYQMLRSIETWLDLREGEVLALEGAEDLDRIGQGGTTVEQVKDTAGSGNVTFRSRSVLEAIGMARTLRYSSLARSPAPIGPGNQEVGDGNTIWLAARHRDIKVRHAGRLRTRGSPGSGGRAAARRLTNPLRPDRGES
jgi:hypothetical protein